jgi:hypothetical protein
MGDLSRDFDRSEFACRDGCGANQVSPRLIDRLQAMRDEVHRPVMIRSGCRCRPWNAHEGGKPDSAHLAIAEEGELCEAADLAAPDSATRYDLMVAAILAGFTRIGIGADFVHLDVDPQKPQEVLWLY